MTQTELGVRSPHTYRACLWKLASLLYRNVAAGQFLQTSTVWIITNYFSHRDGVTGSLVNCPCLFVLFFFKFCMYRIAYRKLERTRIRYLFFPGVSELTM